LKYEINLKSMISLDLNEFLHEKEKAYQKKKM